MTQEKKYISIVHTIDTDQRTLNGTYLACPQPAQTTKIKIKISCPKFKFCSRFTLLIFGIYNGADKSLARSGRKQANVSVRMA